MSKAEERVPYRVEQPQAHPRCHLCWNLDPVCVCGLSRSEIRARSFGVRQQTNIDVMVRQASQMLDDTTLDAAVARMRESMS